MPFSLEAFVIPRLTAVSQKYLVTVFQYLNSNVFAPTNYNL